MAASTPSLSGALGSIGWDVFLIYDFFLANQGSLTCLSRNLVHFGGSDTVGWYWLYVWLYIVYLVVIWSYWGNYGSWSYGWL